MTSSYNIILILSLCFLSILLFSSLSSLYLAYKIYPEIGMVLKSQCKNPTPSWNGKILNFQVWKNGFDTTNASLNTYKDTTADRRLSVSVLNETSKTNLKYSTSHPLIIWGSHHKTGTYLAQKIFSSLCSRMRWCCIHHVTRDSIHAIQRTLQNEPVHLLGHTQWIWLPEELGVPYKFFHFYRHPYKKILSGYRYHRAGAEEWCKKPLEYSKACYLSNSGNGGVVVTNSHNQTINIASAFTKSDKTNNNPYQILNREVVQNYCKSVHLCEPCCRREHELITIKQFDKEFNSHEEKALENQMASLGALKSSRKKHKRVKREIAEKNKVGQFMDPYKELEHIKFHSVGSHRVYAARSDFEYKFMCNTLPNITVSLMHSLINLPIEQGIRIEAAIDYYETLRMAKIYHQTKNDPNSLNIDLDTFMSNYTGTLHLILDKLELSSKLPAETIATIISDLEFYDVNKSPIYRLSMSNPFYNHVDPHQEVGAGINLNEYIYNDSDITQLYKPILKLLDLD